MSLALADMAYWDIFLLVVLTDMAANALSRNSDKPFAMTHIIHGSEGQWSSKEGDSWIRSSLWWNPAKLLLWNYLVLVNHRIPKPESVYYCKLVQCSRKLTIFLYIYVHFLHECWIPIQKYPTCRRIDCV